MKQNDLFILICINETCGVLLLMEICRKSVLWEVSRESRNLYLNSISLFASNWSFFNLLSLIVLFKYHYLRRGVYYVQTQTWNPNKTSFFVLYKIKENSQKKKLETIETSNEIQPNLNSATKSLIQQIQPSQNQNPTFPQIGKSKVKSQESTKITKSPKQIG